MARRIWISDVYVTQEPDALLRRPVPLEAKLRRRRDGLSVFKLVWVAPNITGPQYFIGFTDMDAAELLYTQDVADELALRFRQTTIEDIEVDTAFAPAARTAINEIIVPQGVSGVTGSETKRQATTRLCRAIDAAHSFANLLDRLNLRQRVA